MSFAAPQQKSRLAIGHICIPIYNDFFLVYVLLSPITNMENSFENYKFDEDERWTAYLSRLEITSVNRESALRRLKAKWYKNNVDPTWEDHGTSTPDVATAPTPPPASKPAGQEPRGTTTEPKPRTTENHKLPQTDVVLLVINLLMVPLGLVAVSPFPLSQRSYSLLLLLSLVNQGMKLVKQYGLPGLPLARLKDWGMRALPSTDAHYLSLSLLFLPQPPAAMLVVPLLVLAVYYVATLSGVMFGGAPWWRKWGRPYHQWLASHQQKALLINAYAEVGLGFLLLVQLLTPARAMLLTFAYWNMLKMRYWSADAAQYHRAVWQSMGQRADPYLARVPLLLRVVEMVKKWFNSVR